MSSTKVMIGKITKGGFGRKINSEFGYSSFEILAGSVECSIDPPLDMTTEEGRAEYKRVYASLTSLALASLESDITKFRTKYTELDMTLRKKDTKLAKMKDEHDE